MRWAIIISICVIIGGILWGYGVDRIREDLPFYVKKIMGDIISLEIRGVKIEAEIARSSSEKAKGLSSRESMAPRRSMIFVYDEASILTFWMKDVKFPLDLIWIKDDIIVDITENVATEPGPDYKHYQPKTAVNRVLEVGAGFVKTYNIEIGQKIKYEKSL